MVHLVRSLYNSIRRLPIVGVLVRGIRNLYRHPFFERRRLFSRDFKKAQEIADDLFGIEGSTHVRNFKRSALFKRNFSFGSSGDFDVLMLYTAVRALQPNTIVETGVASGRSSAAILQGLVDNNKGTLYSIDLPQEYKTSQPDTYITREGNLELKGFIPNGEQPGWLVPDDLRSRWKLILGDSNTELPELLARLPKVDMFYHDGDHSFETMSFEFKNIWWNIPAGGVIFSDDIDWNTAWKEFVAREMPARVFSYRHFGIAVK